MARSIGPSGGAHDSFTLGISHREKDGSIVLDLLFERHAPFNPSEVTEEIAALLKSYRCTQVTGDKYAARWVTEAFGKTGITYRQSEADRSAIYLDTLPLFTSGRARLIDSARLVAQFAGLERRTFSTGRDRVDHGKAGREPMRLQGRWCWQAACRCSKCRSSFRSLPAHRAASPAARHRARTGAATLIPMVRSTCRAPRRARHGRAGNGSRKEQTT
jgi:hypothetical protein